MEKLDLQNFRNLKKEVVDFFEKDERRENSREDEDKFIERYKKIIKEFSTHDLSDIDFEEWEGMYLFAPDEAGINIDFSQTKANLDFSKINYDRDKGKVNFKGCNIINFTFEESEYNPEMFDEKFIEENKEYFLGEEVPEDIKKLYYNKEMTLQDLSDNLQYFKDKKIVHSVMEGTVGYKFVQFFKEDILKLFEKYKLMLDKMNSHVEFGESILDEIGVADENMSDEEKNQALASIILRYFNRGNRIDSFQLLKMITDFVPLENVHVQLNIKNFLEKYDIDELIKADFKIQYLTSDEILSNLDEIKKLSNIIKVEDIHALLTVKSSIILKKYSADQLIEYGIKDLKELYSIKSETDLHEIKEELESRPEDLINLGSENDLKLRFIKKYGIDNIIKLDEETNGMFSHKIDEGNDKYLLLMALTEKDLPEIDKSKTLTYEEFKDRMYEVLKDIKSWKKREFYENYDFIEGPFREQYQEIFIDKSVSQEIKETFYRGEMTFEDIRRNPQIKEILLTKDLDIGFRDVKFGKKFKYKSPKNINMWTDLKYRGVLDLAEKYGDYLILPFDTPASLEKVEDFEKEEWFIQKQIEENILNRVSPYNENVPEFFYEKYPEMFLSNDAPEELKSFFYDEDKKSGFVRPENMSFRLIKEHPEWKEFLNRKNLSRAFSKEYDELFKRFDSSTLIKLGLRNPETIEKMVQNHREDTLANWYKATGGKFVPHHVVMLNFPEEEIDNFLSNGKKWSQLMKLDRYNLNDDGKSAILKAAYSMGVFQGEDDGFNKTMQLFTDIPQELSQEEYEKVMDFFEEGYNTFAWNDKQEYEKSKTLFEKAYTVNKDEKNILKIDKNKNKEEARFIRRILEKAELPAILTPQKAHQIFDSFAMNYNPDFAKFFNENIEEILSNPEYTKDVASIQRQFKDIVITNSGRKLTLEVAQDYIRSIAYENIDVGNESVAEQAKIVGYSQEDFEEIQKLYNEGETREFSSIPRIQGEKNGYIYEMLRCDDSLALTIGTLTDCCQEIHGAGQTSMEHSVVSPDGRVFVVRDDEDRIVAQSWFWRNQYTGCFDNIEIPDRIFKLYEKEHPDIGKKGLTKDVLEVYKKAALELMQEDKRVYQELLENGTITQEQYDSLLLGKVTIGLGYNDIADAIKSDNNIHREKDIIKVKGTERLPHPYTDAKTQYTIGQREGIVKSGFDNLYVHQDDIPVYDGTNMSSTLLFTMKRMEKSSGRDNLEYLYEDSRDAELPKSQKIINQLANEYGLNNENTKVMATARMAMIYSNENGKTKIADLFTVPIKENLVDEQKQNTEKHIMYQIKKALKQLGVPNEEFDITSLDDEQQKLLQSAMQEIEKENEERSER